MDLTLLMLWTVAIFAGKGYTGNSTVLTLLPVLRLFVRIELSFVKKKIKEKLIIFNFLYIFFILWITLGIHMFIILIEVNRYL